MYRISGTFRICAALVSLTICALMLADLPFHRFPVLQPFPEFTDGGVRSHSENALSQLLLETVHDREHRDQCRDPERDPEHGGQGNKGNEGGIIPV